MSSIAENLMVATLLRLVTDRVIADTNQIRRDHLTPPSLAQTPRVSVEMGDDLPIGGDRTCSVEHSLAFEVCITVRADQSHAAADPIVLAVLRSLAPSADDPYAHDARLQLVAIRRPRPDIADQDALETRIEFMFKYFCAPWALDTVA